MVTLESKGHVCGPLVRKNADTVVGDGGWVKKVPAGGLFAGLLSGSFEAGVG